MVFGDVVVSTKLEQLYGGVDLLLGRNNNDVDVRVMTSDLGQDLFSRYIGKGIIQGNYSRVLCRLSRQSRPVV